MRKRKHTNLLILLLALALFIDLSTAQRGRSRFRRKKKKKTTTSTTTTTTTTTTLAPKTEPEPAEPLQVVDSNADFTSLDSLFGGNDLANSGVPSPLGGMMDSLNDVFQFNEAQQLAVAPATMDNPLAGIKNFTETDNHRFYPFAGNTVAESQTDPKISEPKISESSISHDYAPMYADDDHKPIAPIMDHDYGPMYADDDHKPVSQIMDHDYGPMYSDDDAVANAAAPGAPSDNNNYFYHEGVDMAPQESVFDYYQHPDYFGEAGNPVTSLGDLPNGMMADDASSSLLESDSSMKTVDESSVDESSLGGFGGAMNFLSSALGVDSGESQDTKDTEGEEEDEDYNHRVKTHKTYRWSASDWPEANLGFGGDNQLKKEEDENILSLIIAIGCANNPDCGIEVDMYTNALRNYGCNCYPHNYDQPSKTRENKTELHFGANGKPFLKDELDQACSDAFKAYRCFNMDARAGNFGKHVHVDECHSGMEFEFHLNSNRNIICGPADNPDYKNNNSKDLKKNNNECKLRSCQIEREFSYSVLGVIGLDPMHSTLNVPRSDDVLLTKEERDDILLTKEGDDVLLTKERDDVLLTKQEI